MARKKLHDWERVYRYANNFRNRRSTTESGTVFPTFRQAAHALRMTLAEVEDACEDAKGNNVPLDIVVGFAVQGMGYAAIECLGDYEIETYDDDENDAFRSNTKDARPILL